MEISDLIDPQVALFSAINFLVVFYVLRRFLLKPFNQIIEDRRQRELQAKEDAERLSYERENATVHYQDIIADAEKQASKIVSEGKQQAEEQAARIRDEAKQRTEKEYAEFKQKLDTEREEMLEDIKHKVVDLTITSTKKVVEKEIDEKADAALVSAYLDSLDKQLNG